MHIKKGYLGGILVCLVLLILNYSLLPKNNLYIPNNFSFTADVVSIDNFYDVQSQDYQGPQISNTDYYFTLLKRENGVSTVSNVFHVKDLTGDTVVKLERQYAIDEKNGSHVAGFGDEDRSGYLFAPKNILEGQEFDYWHINYDAPATMKYVGKEKLYGLNVFKYQADYSASLIDQTEFLTHLSGVPEKYKVILEPNLTIWVDPISGHLVNYQDNTIAYFYDAETRQKLYPWNNFQNTLSEQAVKKLVFDVNSKKFTRLMGVYIMPIFLGSLALLFLLFSITNLGKKIQNISYVLINAVCVLAALGGLIVVIGWIYSVPELKSFFPGLVTMKITTAICFILSGLLLFFSARFIKGKRELAYILIPATSLTIFLLMGVQLISVVLGVPTGIESLFIQEDINSVLTSVPGRPSVGTMVCFLVCASLGLFTLFDSLKTSKVFNLGGLTIITISLFSLFGYLINNPLFYFHYPKISTGMAFHTVVLFLIIGLGFYLVKYLTHSKAQL
jgi:hypothetical protein